MALKLILHYVHQLVGNFVCVPFGDQQYTIGSHSQPPTYFTILKTRSQLSDISANCLIILISYITYSVNTLIRWNVRS